MSFEGQVALITGAASGIGRATAERFARHRAIVVLSDIAVADGEDVAARIRAEGSEATFIRADVSNYDEVV